MSTRRQYGDQHRYQPGQSSDGRVFVRIRQGSRDVLYAGLPGRHGGTTWTITAGYEYDKDGNISRISPVAYDSHGNDYGSLNSYAAVDYSYNDGKLDRIDSERGGYAEFYYDEHGNLTSVDEYAGRGSDAEFEFEHEVEYQRYFCNKHEKNKPEEWIRLDAEYDVDGWLENDLIMVVSAGNHVQARSVRGQAEPVYQVAAHSKTTQSGTDAFGWFLLKGGCLRRFVSIWQ